MSKVYRRIVAILLALVVVVQPVYGGNGEKEYRFTADEVKRSIDFLNTKSKSDGMFCNDNIRVMGIITQSLVYISEMYNDNILEGNYFYNYIYDKLSEMNLSSVENKSTSY